MSKLAVITCHFNFGGFTLPKQHLRRFARQMARDCIPLYGIEICLPGQTPTFHESSYWKVIRTGTEAILWQKEALLNKAAKMVPRHIPYIAAVDADTLFGNPNWVAETCRALESAPVVQPFDTAVWLDRDGSELARLPSFVSAAPTSYGHPGFAWAFRREFFHPSLSFYPLAVIGTGDLVFARTIAEKSPYPDVTIDYVGVKNTAKLTEWSQRIRAWSLEELPAVRGELFHEWHGSREDRALFTRTGLIAQYDADLHTRITEHGNLEWTPEAPSDIRDAVATYFISRREDG